MVQECWIRYIFTLLLPPFLIPNLG